MKVDLHCHSNLSDGQLSPVELVRYASNLGLDMLAITDHDRADKLPEVVALAETLKVRLVSGIELSCRWNKMTVHVVGLNIMLDSSAVHEMTSRQSRARQQRAVEIGNRLDKLNIPDCYQGASVIAGQSQIGRPHFAQYLLKIGAVKDLNAAYKRYLGAGKVGDVKAHWPELEEAVTWIQGAGGLAVLAHPAKYNLSRRKLDLMCDAFKEAGGDALELVSGLQAENVTEYHQQLCRKYGLYASCGSDFHGPVSSWHDLGKMAPLPVSCNPVWECWDDKL